RDLNAAFDALLRVPAVTSVLTSGGHPSVLDAVATITRLVRQAAGSTCTVLAGSGLTIDAVGDFVRATGVRAVHFGSGVRPRGEVLAPVDQPLVERVRAAIDGAAAHV
ncbi:copper homeostasis protein CutC, partial [Burkholderia sp. LMG 13014]